MTNSVRLIDIRESPLSIDEMYEAVRDPAAGGIALFVGTVRNIDDERNVDVLGYSSHPTAIEQMANVAQRIADSSDIVAIAGIHRVGTLAIGDLAVVVAVSAEHRAQAFDACRALIDELKTEVPIWKHQTFTSGDAIWV